MECLVFFSRIDQRGFHRSQRTQRTQRNYGRNAINTTHGTDATTASIIAFWPLRQLRLLRRPLLLLHSFRVSRTLLCSLRSCVRCVGWKPRFNQYFTVTRHLRVTGTIHHTRGLHLATFRTYLRFTFFVCSKSSFTIHCVS